MASSQLSFDNPFPLPRDSCGKRHLCVGSSGDICLRHTAVTSKNRNRHLNLGRNSDCPPFILSSSTYRIDVTLDHSIYSPGLDAPYIRSCLTVDTLHIYPHHSYQRRDRSIYLSTPENSLVSTFILIQPSYRHEYQSQTNPSSSYQNSAVQRPRMLFKITVLGEGGVGKTALTVQVSFLGSASWRRLREAEIGYWKSCLSPRSACIVLMDEAIETDSARYDSHCVNSLPWPPLSRHMTRRSKTVIENNGLWTTSPVC